MEAIRLLLEKSTFHALKRLSKGFKKEASGTCLNLPVMVRTLILSQ